MDKKDFENNSLQIYESSFDLYGKNDSEKSLKSRFNNGFVKNIVFFKSIKRKK